MSNPPAAKVDPWWFAGALVVGDLFYWIFRYLYDQWCVNLPLIPGSYEHGAKLTNAMIGVILVLTLVMMRSLQNAHLDRQPSWLRRACILPALLVFFALQIGSWSVEQRHPWLYMEDIGRSTIAAEHVLWHGGNPYAAHVDPTAGALAPGAHLDGYKYLPLTLAAYMPFALLCRNGDWAILAGNLVFSIAAALTLALCLRKWISWDAMLLGATFWFMPAIFTELQLFHGANDTLAMIPLMLALYFIERRFTCGLLVGLAISTKLLPGALCVGLLCCLPFLAWNPRAFIENIVVFNALRPIGMTSVLVGQPRWVDAAAKSAFMGLYAITAARTWRTDISPITRCGYAVVITICFLFASPMNHPNYFIWWFTPLCVVVTAFVFNPAIYQWIRRPAS